MNKKLMIYAVFTFVFSCLTLFSSCNKADSDIDESIQAFVDDAEEDVQLQTRSGSGSCFELVYPITITFPDQTSLEVDSKETLKASAKNWKENNPDTKGRIKVQFPIEVVTSDGDLVSIDSIIELKELRRSCKDKPNFGDKRPCFRLIYPVSLIYPNGKVVQYENRFELKQALRLWKKKNPNADMHPRLSFPLQIKLKDGTIQEIDSRATLKTIKEDC